MRQFETGATRDDLAGKLSYMKALSPAVLRRYVQYLAEHRQQADGGLRAFDNWKRGIPQDTYLDSLLRHVWDTWLTCNGEKPSDCEYSLVDLLCAIIFNAHGMLFEILNDTGKATRENCSERTPITDPARLLLAVAESLKPQTCRDCAKTYTPGHPCSNPAWEPTLDYPDNSPCFVPRVSA